MNEIITKWENFESDDQILNAHLKNKDYSINDFDERLSFGTAGIRGIFGAGLNKINVHTISMAADSYAKYLVSNSPKSIHQGIVVAHDNRANGSYYADHITKIFNSYKIPVYRLSDGQMMPTPLLSFAIREINAIGGINITASHNTKEYNGFKVYNELGAQLMPKEAIGISKFMNTCDPFSIKRGGLKYNIIDKKLVDKYVKKVSGLRLNKNDNGLRISYSPLSGTGISIGNSVLTKSGFSVDVVANQNYADPEFKHVKSPNPEEPLSYSEVIKLSRKKKSDIALITDPDADRVGAVVKYKKRYKYLTGNDIAALYLDYYLNWMTNNNGIPQNSYIVKSNVSSDLVSKIANKYGVEVVEVHVGFKNIANIIDNKKGNFIFAFEESYGMLIDKNISRDKDAFQGLVCISDMANYYKGIGVSLFERLKLIQGEHNIHRNLQKSINVDEAALNRIYKTILKAKIIAGIKVVDTIDYRKSKNNYSNFVKVFLEDGSWIAIRPSGTEPKIKCYVQSIGSGSDLIHSVIKEEKIFDYINELTEEIKDKSFSWKAVFKYTTFLAIVVLLLYLLFKYIYGEYSSSSNAFAHAISFYDTKIKAIFLLYFGSLFVSIFVDSWMKYRLLKFHEQNVKVYQLIISSIMGSIVSYLTPLAIGGDGIGYWYLRRRGFKRAPLAATFLSTTILWQIKNIILTAIIVPMGFDMFKDILLSDDPAAKSVVILFIVGLSWDLFSTFMIWFLLGSRWFQEFCIRNAIKLLEWFPYITISDPGKKAGKFMHEFSELRLSLKKMWKKPLVMLEALFYSMLPKLLSIGALIPVLLNITDPDLKYGGYWSQIVASDVISTANSLSLTPGSTGFIEYISLHINEKIYVGTPTSKDTAISLDIIIKLVSQWPYLLVSSMTALVMIFGESRRKYKGKNSNTSIYKKVAFIWPLLLGAWITLIFLL